MAYLYSLESRFAFDEKDWVRIEGNWEAKAASRSQATQASHLRVLQLEQHTTSGEALSERSQPLRQSNQNRNTASSVAVSSKCKPEQARRASISLDLQPQNAKPRSSPKYRKHQSINLSQL
ncbi:uncharacterized protein MCYG_00666 [Microsporum canis CBS 113480]|uniref:Uncharacterized protein n=1 Tax=Arthroderma otae (strain ATCC MYA-4605 / CBS 113480) TaxID=554155 RepID=C5FD94_ARTOC|nr:uncharacterized protein MCYG_00666 [Microsporum canis CBS 113480]EEQ27778.1 predicted protein [Microsporum canis CBS 113480]